MIGHFEMEWATLEVHHASVDMTYLVMGYAGLCWEELDMSRSCLSQLYLGNAMTFINLYSNHSKPF